MNLLWDDVKSGRALLIRRMIYDDPRKVIKEYGQEKLKETFLKYIHRFDKVNRAFWSLVLEITDEELLQKEE